MIYNLCTHKIKGDMPLKWWISKDKPYVGKTKIDKRVEANLQLVKQLNSLGVPKNQIFVTGHSCGGLTTLLFFSRHPDEAAGGIAYMQACFGKLTKQYKVKKLSTENNELYGSVKPTEIAKLIQEENQIEIKPSMIQPVNEFKALGKVKVKIS